MAVQAFMTLALIFCCSAHIASTMLLVRWPLNFTFRHQWQILSVCTLMNGLTTLCLFLSVAVFGGQCWRRDWMLYPNFNYLSWSYAFAVIAMFVGMAATACFYFVSLLFSYIQNSTPLIFNVDRMPRGQWSAKRPAVTLWFRCNHMAAKFTFEKLLCVLSFIISHYFFLKATNNSCNCAWISFFAPLLIFLRPLLLNREWILMFVVLIPARVSMSFKNEFGRLIFFTWNFCRAADVQDVFHCRQFHVSVHNEQSAFGYILFELPHLFIITSWREKNRFVFSVF